MIGVFELTSGKGADVVFDTVGGPMFEPAVRSLAPTGRQVSITSAGDPRVSFNLVDFYHNRSRLIGVDSCGPTLQQVAHIQNEINKGFEIGALKPPATEVIPFEDAINSYNRVVSHQSSTK